MSYTLRNLIDASTLARREKAVLRELAWYVWDKRGTRATCSITQLVYRSGYSQRTVRRTIAEFRDQRIISVIDPHGPDHPRTYEIHLARIPKNGYFGGTRGISTGGCGKLGQ
jgi:hypothetical protein